MIGLKSIRIFPKAIVSTSNVGTAVSASFDSSTGAVTISSTSGVGTIDKTKLADFWNTCGKDNIKTITFTNQVYAPQDSSSLFYGLEYVTNIDANYLNTSKVTNMRLMFGACRGLTELESIKNWNVSNVTDMGGMFTNCSGLTTLEGLRNWNISNVTNMWRMFGNCGKLTTLEFIRNWNVSNVTDMAEMFISCTGLTTLEPIRDWNVSNVTDMNSMFYNCTSLTTLEAIGNWNIGNVTSMSFIFHNCRGLTTLEGLSNWNVSNIKYMSNMFWNCTGLTTLEPIRNWNIGTNNISGMFEGCTGLTTLEPIRNWNVSNVKDMSSMFEDCIGLTTLEPISNWNVSNVKDMRCMFEGCTGLTTLEPIRNWNVSNVTNMWRMFEGCTSLTTLEPISNWNVSNVTNMWRMFGDCTGLITLDLSNWNTENVTNISELFYNCINLKSLNLSSWNIEKVQDYKDMIKGCDLLDEIYTPIKLPQLFVIDLPSSDFRDVDDLSDKAYYNKIEGLDEKFSKSVHLARIVIIKFRLSIANDYKLEEYESLLKDKIILKGDIKNMTGAGGTEGLGEDILPVTQDGKSIFWDNSRLESETGYTFAGWESSYDNNIYQVPFVQDYSEVDEVYYTAVFRGYDRKYNLKLTDVGEATDKLLANTNYRIDGFGREKYEEKEYVTDENGTLLIEGLELNEEYTLTELRVRPGYKLSEMPVKFKAISEDGILKFNIISGEFLEIPFFIGSTVEVKWQDEILFKVEKVDDETGEHLQGAKFTVKDENGNYAKDVDGNQIGTVEIIDGEEMPVITTNRLGVTGAELDKGKYTVTEVKAPFGYDLPENREQNLEVSVLQKEEMGLREVWHTSFVTDTNDVIERVLLTKDGGHIFIGSLGKVDALGFSTENGQNIIVKYDKDEKIVWRTNFPYGYPEMIEETYNEGLIVVGARGMVEYERIDNGYREVWKNSISSDGTTVKCRYGTQTEDGGFLLTGNMTRTFRIGSNTLSLKGKMDMFIIKYDSNKNIKWTYNIATSSNYVLPATIVETQDKGFVIGGGFKGTMTISSSKSFKASGSDYGGFLLKFRARGTNEYDLEWSDQVCDIGRITGLCETTDGKIVMCGVKNNAGFIRGYELNGRQVFHKQIGNSGNLLNHIAPLKDGNFVVAGSITRFF